jgi:hypothetical protein
MAMIVVIFVGQLVSAEYLLRIAFFLIGALDSNLESNFRIGSNATVTSSADGELTCFANDIEAMYWNNLGIVELVITRTA